ncbi:MAG: VWA domain-containing protein [Candidatus Methanoperedens sp.]|nr:VWA domain-containing protein [Candidatus Methanoperedens sp.]
MELANPLVLLLISPVVLAGWYAIRKGIPRALIISRVIILSLLIIALASPFTLGTSTVRDEVPRITVISDQTMSMDLFNKDTGTKIFESIKSKTPTTYRQFAGISSSIGDEVINNAENNNLVLVSDGNNNHGKDLFDAISFVSRTWTKVFAVKQKPVHNDASVEIESAKNLIIGNENVFNVVVRQAGNETSYRLDVEIDGVSVKLPDESKNVVQTERVKVIPVSATFNSLGTHKVTATITPSDEDWFKLNNVFYKSVFVVPKPKVLAVTDDTTSPLYKIATSLYEVATKDTVPDDLSSYKTVIIDNKGAGQLSAESLRKYVGSGGGLVVVGGDAAYDRGEYNNSDIEKILPIISRQVKYGGEITIIIVIDSSGSTTGDRIGIIDANAIKIVKDSKLDTRVGVVAFGGGTALEKPPVVMSSANKNLLESEISDIGPKDPNLGTNLDVGLKAATKMIKGISGRNYIVVISDGEIKDVVPNSKKVLDEVKNQDIGFFFVDIEGISSSMKELADYTGGEYIPLKYNQIANLVFDKKKEEGTPPTPTPTPEGPTEFKLIVVDTNHFITKYLNLTARITGYNRITYKLGSDNLVAIDIRGEPILTTWGFGLGRVASFTTDNGNPSSDLSSNRPWASMVYSGENPRLISSMINWAIGDPRPREGVVIQAEDIWAGTPGRVVVTSNTLPQVKLDGKALDLTRTGPTTYEATINLEKTEFHDLSGYGIAVNYPLEYREVGFNEKLNTVIESNGGRVYDESEVEGLLLLDIKEKAVRTVQEPKSQKEPFLLAALGLFLAEVIIRRLRDYRKERPDIQDNPPRAEPPATVVEPVAAE